LFAAEGQQLPGQRSGALRGVGDFLRRPPQPGIGPDTFEQKLGIAGDHHQQVVEVVGDATGEAADRLHFLRLAELQLQYAGFGNVFHEKFEAASFLAIWNRASGNTRHDGRAILADALRGQVVEFLPRVKIISGLKPLLGVGVQASQMSAREIGGAVGVAIYGSIFSNELRAWITRLVPPDALVGRDPNSLQASPAVIHALPEPVRDAIAHATSNALSPVFVVAALLAAAGFVMVLFLEERPLRTGR